MASARGSRVAGQREARRRIAAFAGERLESAAPLRISCAGVKIPARMTRAKIIAEPDSESKVNRS
jgi:hypothetical protein